MDPKTPQFCIVAVDALQRPRVIIAPAQFGVPKDYDDLSALLRQRGHTVACAPLSRLSWLRIVPSVFTEAFFKGELKPQGTLDFFFEALDAAVADVGPDEDIAILGHSIGGWVARAWVVDRGEQRVKRFVTLGTPHNEPPEGLFSNIDQTRGLLKYVRANCPPDPSIFTCVAGTATSTAALGDVFKLDAWDEELRRSPLLEALVSLPSYLALSGRNPFGVKGDGLIPVATACLADCPAIEVDCHHSDFVPTALDSIRLPETYPWYGSPAVFGAWADALSIN